MRTRGRTRSTPSAAPPWWASNSEIPLFQLLQIGSTWVLTAAHCLFKDGEQVAAKTLSILLGLHDRSKTSELNRCIELKREMSSALIVVICCRKKVRVDEIFLHENFTTTGSKANDIALLRLGKNSYQPKRIWDLICLDHFQRRRLFLSFHSEERVDLSTFPPACLPTKEYNPEGKDGHVYGERKVEHFSTCFHKSNWPSIGNIYVMEDFKGKEIERQNYTYGQDGALQENTVQSNFKKPRSY